MTNSHLDAQIKQLTPLRKTERGDWSSVLASVEQHASRPALRGTARDREPQPRARFLARKRQRVCLAAFAILLGLVVPVLALGATRGWFTRSGSTVPSPLLFAVHGRIMGWTRTDDGWAIVFLSGKASGRCGMNGASWHLGIASGHPLPFHLTSVEAVEPAMCGNRLQWVRSGSFSDGKHTEVAFMLWTTPSLGASAYVYRVTEGRLELLRRFAGDGFTLEKGKVVATFENRQRSPNGHLTMTYVYAHGNYHLVQIK